jgi:hypothetical protein
MTDRDLVTEVALLTRALKAPRCARRCRGWPRGLGAVLIPRGATPRLPAARGGRPGVPWGEAYPGRAVPGRKSPEEFDFDHVRGLKRELIVHLGTLDFVTAKHDVLLLGPPDTGKTHLVTGLATRACQTELPRSRPRRSQPVSAGRHLRRSLPERWWTRARQAAC